VERGGSDKDNLYVPRQQDQAEGEPEDVEEDLKAQKKKIAKTNEIQRPDGDKTSSSG
jgi:hypothetical protein